MKVPKIIEKLLENILDKSLSLVKEDSDYHIFFKGMLKKYGVKSPSELKGSKKLEFFKEVKSEWAKKKK